MSRGVLSDISCNFRHGHGSQGTSDDKSVRPGSGMRPRTGETIAASRPLAIRGKYLAAVVNKQQCMSCDMAAVDPLFCFLMIID